MTTVQNLVENNLDRKQLNTADPQRWLAAAVQIWGLGVLILHLAAFNLPEESTWSVWPYTFLPAWLAWGLALFAGALIVPSVSHRVGNLLTHVWRAWPAKHAKQRWFLLIAILAGPVFWLARLRHLRWGDSYLLSVALSYPDLELRVIYNWQAPLTVFLHQRLWQFVADPWLGWPVEQVYATVSIICGVLFVYILLNFVSNLGRDPLEMAILAGLVLTTGAMQLFFGYVENYVIVSLILLLTLWLAWLALQGQLRPVWPVLGLSAANAFHPSTVFIWPGMWLLSFLCWRRGRVSATGAILQTILPPFLVGTAVFALMESGGHGVAALLGQDRPGGGDAVWFVPLFETDPEWSRYQPYTMFSAAHLIDWLNIHLLISPFGMPLIVITLVVVAGFRLTLFDRAEDKDFAVFLGLLSFMYILFTWLWNADYGGRKDWDLFAPSAFVYTFFAGYLLVRAVSNRQMLKELGVFSVVVALIHTAAWVFANTHHLPLL